VTFCAHHTFIAGGESRNLIKLAANAIHKLMAIDMQLEFGHLEVRLESFTLSNHLSATRRSSTKFKPPFGQHSIPSWKIATCKWRAAQNSQILGIDTVRIRDRDIHGSTFFRSHHFNHFEMSMASNCESRDALKSLRLLNFQAYWLMPKMQFWLKSNELYSIKVRSAIIGITDEMHELF
jgi:hypothetical protein